MAQVVYLKIQVDDAQLDELKAGLTEVGGKVEIIEGNSQKVNKGFKSIGKSSIVFQQLNKLTGGLAGNLVDVYNGLGKINIGLKATKAALISTGIGALVVGLGLVVAYWDEINEFMTGANQKAQMQIDLTKETLENLDFEYKLLELKEKKLEAEGKSTEEIKKKKEEILLLQIEQNKLLLTQLETQFSLEKSKAEEYTWWEKIKATASTYYGLGKFQPAINKEEEAALKAKTDEINAIILATQEAETALALLLNPKSKSGKADSRPQAQRVDTISGADANKMQIEEQRRLFEELARTEVDGKQLLQDSANIANQEFLNSELAFQAARTQQEKDYADVRKRIAEMEFQSKVRSMYAYGDAAMEVGNLIGEQTALGKGLSIAGALINTYASIAAQLKVASASPGAIIPGYAIAQAIATGAAGFAAVKQILAVKVPGQGGGSGGGAVQASPPAFNVVDSSPQNQLNQALLEQNDRPVQAFVVEGEVSNAEQLRRNKISASSLG